MPKKPPKLFGIGHFKTQLLILQPENPAYPSLYFTPDEQDRIRIIGKVLHVKFRL